MARSELLTIAAFTFVLAISFSPVSSIKCWVCNSANYQDCGDPFNDRLLPPSLLVDCPHHETGIGACVKAEVESTGVIHRLCSNETLPNVVNFLTPSCSYKHVYVVDNVRHTDYEADTCELCYNEDGCNGSSIYGPVAVPIAISVALLKILSF